MKVAARIMQKGWKELISEPFASSFVTKTSANKNKKKRQPKLPSFKKGYYPDHE